MTLPLYVFDEEAKLAREALGRERDFMSQPSNSPGWQPGIGESLPGQPGGPSWGTQGGYGAESSQEPFSWTRHAAMKSPGWRPGDVREEPLPNDHETRDKLQTACDRLREEGERSGFGPDWQRAWWAAGCGRFDRPADPSPTLDPNKFPIESEGPGVKWPESLTPKWEDFKWPSFELPPSVGLPGQGVPGRAGSGGHLRHPKSACAQEWVRWKNANVGVSHRWQNWKSYEMDNCPD